MTEPRPNLTEGAVTEPRPNFLGAIEIETETFIIQRGLEFPFAGLLENLNAEIDGTAPKRGLWFIRNFNWIVYLIYAINLLLSWNNTFCRSIIFSIVLISILFDFLRIRGNMELRRRNTLLRDSLIDLRRAHGMVVAGIVQELRTGPSVHRGDDDRSIYKEGL